MRLPEAIYQRAALAATGVVLVAVFPFFYQALLAVHAHFPPLPLFFAMAVFLGLPGIYIANWVPLNRIESFEVRFLLAVLAAWIFYFFLFWVGLYWKSRRKPVVLLRVVPTEVGKSNND